MKDYYLYKVIKPFEHMGKKYHFGDMLTFKQHLELPPFYKKEKIQSLASPLEVKQK